MSDHPHDYIYVLNLGKCTYTQISTQDNDVTRVFHLSYSAIYTNPIKAIHETCLKQKMLKGTIVLIHDAHKSTSCIYNGQTVVPIREEPSYQEPPTISVQYVENLRLNHIYLHKPDGSTTCYTRKSATLSRIMAILRTYAKVPDIPDGTRITYELYDLHLTYKNGEWTSCTS